MMDGSGSYSYNDVIARLEGEELEVEELRGFLKYLEEIGETTLLECLEDIYISIDKNFQLEDNNFIQKYPRYFSDSSAPSLTTTASTLSAQLHTHLTHFQSSRTTLRASPLSKHVSINGLSQPTFERAISNDLILNNFQNYLQKEGREVLLSFYLAVRRFKSPIEDPPAKRTSSKFASEAQEGHSSSNDASELSSSRRESRKAIRTFSITQAVDPRQPPKRPKRPKTEDVLAIDRKYLGIVEGSRGSFVYEVDLRREFKAKVESGAVEWGMFDGMVECVKADLEVLYVEFFTAQLKGQAGLGGHLKVKNNVERSKSDNSSSVQKRKVTKRRLKV